MTTLNAIDHTVLGIRLPFFSHKPSQRCIHRGARPGPYQPKIRSFVWEERAPTALIIARLACLTDERLTLAAEALTGPRTCSVCWFMVARVSELRAGGCRTNNALCTLSPGPRLTPDTISRRGTILVEAQLSYCNQTEIKCRQ